MPNEHGMEYENVRRRVNRMKKTEKEGKVKNFQLKHNLQESLINQARRRDGDGAARELRRELNHKQSKWI